ncbi:MAG: T9SS type A sorting domain-containing protein [Saprospiraceae bacterium]
MDKNLYSYLLLFFLLSFSISSIAQDIAFSEDFSTVPNGTGYLGSGPEPVTIGQGQAYLNGATLFPFLGRFSVHNQQLQADAVVGEVSWVSDPIDISCFSEVYIAASLSSDGLLNSGTMGADQADYIAIDIEFVEASFTIYNFYRVAGAITGIDNWQSAVPINACGSPIAQTIILTFRFANDQYDEGYNFHSVSVTGNMAEVQDVDYTLTCDDVSDMPDLQVTAQSGSECPLEYSLNNVTYQASGTFADLTPGNYTVYIRDKNFPSCASTSIMVTVADCAALPIELVSFAGHPEEHHILLDWETANEINNDYIAVERSQDGISFRELGKVKGAGTTSEAQYYEFLDRQPLPGLNYYRLRQVDFDGAFEYHPTIAVEMISRTTPPAIKIYPSIAANEVTIELGFIPRQKITYTIHSLLGQEVQSGIFERETSYKTLPVSELPAGSYVFNTVNEGKRYTARFIKQ